MSWAHSRDKAVRGTEEGPPSTHQHYLGTLPLEMEERLEGKMEKIHWQGIP